MRSLLIALILALLAPSASFARSPAQAMWGAMGGWNLTTFDTNVWQGWTPDVFAFNSSITHSGATSAHLGYSVSGTLTKTDMTDIGEFSVWTYVDGTGTGTYTFQIDSETPVTCKPTAVGEWQQFTQTITTKDSHTLTISGTTGAGSRFYVDDIRYRK